MFYIADPGKIKLARVVSQARFVENLTGVGDVLLAACGDDGVIGYDMSKPSLLNKLWTLKTSGYAHRAKVQGNLMYVAQISSLAIYDRENLGGKWE